MNSGRERTNKVYAKKKVKRSTDKKKSENVGKQEETIMKKKKV